MRQYKRFDEEVFKFELKDKFEEIFYTDGNKEIVDKKVTYDRKEERKNIPEFIEAIEVALGTKLDYRDFISKGKSITYSSAKGKQAIKDLNDLNKALLDRLEVVGGGGVRRSKGHYSLGHIIYKS